MATNSDGGPAFPRPSGMYENEYGAKFPEYGDPGMTLRDWFAGQALASGWCRASDVPERELREMFGGRIAITREEIVAAEAYAFADAMLARRAR